MGWRIINGVQSIEVLPYRSFFTGHIRWKIVKNYGNYGKTVFRGTKEEVDMLARQMYSIEPAPPQTAPPSMKTAGVKVAV
jgi:hypothetical protein